MCPACWREARTWRAQWWGQLLSLGKFGTVLLFDTGVYLVVFGAATAVLLGMLEPEADDDGEEAE